MSTDPSPSSTSGQKSNTDIDPVAANLDSVTPIAPPWSARPRLSDVLRAGLVTGITASIINTLLWLITWAVGVDYTVALGRDQGMLMTITPWQIFLVVMISALLYALLMAGLRGRKYCRKIALVIGYLAAVGSLAGPALQAQTWPTFILLSLMHVITALLVVPQVARVVGDADPRALAGYRKSEAAAS